MKRRENNASSGEAMSALLLLLSPPELSAMSRPNIVFQRLPCLPIH